MKKINIIVLLVLLCGFMFVFTSCEEEIDEVTIPERISELETDLNNGDYGSVYLNFHPDMPSYDSYKSESVINVGFLSDVYAPFNFGTPTVLGSSASGTFSHSLGGTGTYTATMKEDGSDNWKILSLSITIGTSTSTYAGKSK